MTSSPLAMQLYNVSINYKKANRAIRGQFSLTPDMQCALLRQAKAENLSLFVLSTCNRTEIMGFAQNPYQFIHLLMSFSQSDMETLSQVASVYKNQEAVHHLFRTAVGLNSQILGDHEISGQLKQAFAQAKNIGTTNSYLERLFNTVLQASKAVKEQTHFSQGTTSMSFACVQYLQQHFSALEQKNILLYGLGEIGQNTAKHLLKQVPNASLCLINRNVEKAENFRREFHQVRLAHEEDLQKELACCDIFILATGAEKPLIHTQHIDKKHPLTIVDLSLPSNLAPEIQHLPKVHLIHLDALSKITQQTQQMREAKIPAVEALLQQYELQFFTWVAERKLSPTIWQLKLFLQQLQQKEMQSVSQHLADFNAEQAQLLTDRLLQKILNHVVTYLKNPQTDLNLSLPCLQAMFNLEDFDENH